jgi:hypothetical protein
VQYIAPEKGPEYHHGTETRMWQTPAGNGATLTYRADTTDWNTISACLLNPYGGGDEYHLPPRTR